MASLRLIIGAVRTADFRTFVPIHPHPSEPIKDELDGVIDVPLLVGVVNPKDELATVSFRLEPVEEGRADPTDMKKARGTRCETCAYAHETR